MWVCVYQNVDRIEITNQYVGIAIKAAEYVVFFRFNDDERKSSAFYRF